MKMGQRLIQRRDGFAPVAGGQHHMVDQILSENIRHMILFQIGTNLLRIYKGFHGSPHPFPFRIAGIGHTEYDTCHVSLSISMKPE